MADKIIFRAKARGRVVHARRSPDILMGSIINGTKKKARELALQRKLVLAESRTKFNDVIRANSPTIYLVDPDLIGQSVIDAIQSQEGANPYISGISIQGQATSFAGDADFAKAFQLLQTRLPALKANISSRARKELIAGFPQVTVQQLANIAETVYLEMVAALQKAESRNKKTYSEFRVAAAKAGANIRRQLNALGVSIIANPELMIENVSNRVPFLGFTFDTAVSKINSIIQTAILDEIKKDGTLTLDESKFKIGNLVHAGHVGIYQDNNLIGINMPSGIIAGVATNKLEQIEQAIGAIPIHIEHGLRLTKDFSEAGGIFLDLQFNFAVSMQAAINSAELGPQEQAAIRSVVGAIGDEALFEVLKSRTGTEAFREIAQEIVPITESSETLLEFIQNLIGHSVAGKTKASLKQTTPQFLGTPVTSASLVLGKAKKTSAKAKAKPKVRTPAIKRAQVGTSSASLLAILNLGLAEQIRRNMGTGNSKTLLNYRTGRFAESAKVVRVSESRQGMITAFYTYMKNPYATFSQGGRQELPKSRDPKLLISKSIRELMQEQMANRMRAVAI